MADEAGNKSIFTELSQAMLPSWGSEGWAFSQNTATESEFPMGGQFDSQNRLVIYDYLNNGSDNAAIWRFHRDGSPDNSFGTNGVVSWDSPGNKKDILYGMKITTDNTIMLGGVSQDELGKIKPLLGKFVSAPLTAGLPTILNKCFNTCRTTGAI